MSHTVTVTDDSFDKDVIAVSSDRPVLVDFWATWCAPCKLIAPVLEEIADEYADKITIAKIDVDENPQVARDHQVMSIPTLMVFKDGVVVHKIVGTKGKAALLRELETAGAL